jgi:hypothetical protein
MTFAELADARGISKSSAIKLVHRHGWRRQRDDQGHVRALVPLRSRRISGSSLIRHAAKGRFALNCGRSVRHSVHLSSPPAEPIPDVSPRSVTNAVCSAA